LCFVDFTYKREFDTNQRTNLLSAFEVIDSLKESIIKAYENNEEKKILCKSPIVGNKIIDDSDEKNYNFNSKENIFYYNTTETVNNQTYDNQILQTEKNYYNDKEKLQNLQIFNKESIRGNKNPNNLLFENLTIESESNLF